MALATNSEALAEFAWNAGMDNPDKAWLLHDWDIWVANPHYAGVRPPHPEDDYAHEALAEMAQRDEEYDLVLAGELK